MSAWTHTPVQIPLVQIISRKFIFPETHMKINLACVQTMKFLSELSTPFHVNRTARITRASFSQSLRAREFMRHIFVQVNWIGFYARVGELVGSVCLRHSSSLVTSRRRGQLFEHKKNWSELRFKSASDSAFKKSLQLICIVAKASIPPATYYRHQVLSIASSIATGRRLSSCYWAFWIVSRVSWLQSLSELISSRKVAKGKSSDRWREKKFRSSFLGCPHAGNLHNICRFKFHFRRLAIRGLSSHKDFQLHSQPVAILAERPECSLRKLYFMASNTSDTNDQI